MCSIIGVLNRSPSLQCHRYSKVITGPLLLQFMACNVDFGIPSAALRSLIVLLWERGTSFTASRTSSWFHFRRRPLLHFLGLARNCRMSGLLKFATARVQTLLIVFVQTWYSRATALKVPRANLPSSLWRSINNLEIIWLHWSLVKSFFLLPSWTGLGWGSGLSIVRDTILLIGRDCCERKKGHSNNSWFTECRNSIQIEDFSFITWRREEHSTNARNLVELLPGTVVL